MVALRQPALPLPRREQRPASRPLPVLDAQSLRQDRQQTAQPRTGRPLPALATKRQAPTRPRTRTRNARNPSRSERRGVGGEMTPEKCGTRVEALGVLKLDGQML